jgi:hypothetical protein
MRITVPTADNIGNKPFGNEVTNAEQNGRLRAGRFV